MVTSSVDSVKESRLLATTEGSLIQQTFIRVNPDVNVTAVAADKLTLTGSAGGDPIVLSVAGGVITVTGLPEALLAQRDFVRGTIGLRWKAAIVSASGSTMLDYAALLCALQAVGAQPRPSLVILAYTSGKLLALIPLTPGGLGFVEAGTLTLAGVAPGDALLATLAYRLVSYWLPIPVGIVAYGAFRRRYPSPNGQPDTRTAER